MSEETVVAGATRQEQETGDGRERLVESRCGFAEMAQREADAAAARLAEVRRLYEDHTASLVEAQAVVDPGVTKTAKEKAHSSFRAAVAAARSRGQVEAAAVAWLSDINRINMGGRAALAHIARGRAAIAALDAQLVTLADTAEAAAAIAAAAQEACRAARAAVEAAAAARLAEKRADGAWTPEVEALAAKAAARAAEAKAAASAPASIPPLIPAASSAPAGPGASALDPSSPDSLFIDLSASHPQVIVRLLRGDGRTMSALVDHLAGDDPGAQSVWQLRLSNFIDSIVAAAIDDGSFEFTPGNAFWDQFSAAESREITRGLAALGYRYDGFEGFVDGRVPAQRDLALALGQVGLLPVKVRHWPTAEEAEHLFKGVTVSADRFVAVRAPTLTLGELVALLGRRAELLAELWNEWPRCRPLLFSTGL